MFLNSVCACSVSGSLKACLYWPWLSECLSPCVDKCANWGMSQGKFGDNYCLGVIRPSFNSISHQITSKWSVGGGWEQTAHSARWRSPRGPLPPGTTCAVWLEEPDWISLRAETNQQLIRSYIHLCLLVSICVCLPVHHLFPFLQFYLLLGDEA